MKTKTAVNLSTYYTIYNWLLDVSQNLESGRRHYRTKDGRLLTKFDQVVLAIQEDNLMLTATATQKLESAPQSLSQEEQVGILYTIQPQDLPIDQAISNAIRLFRLALHCQGHNPREAHLNPKDLNGLQTTKHGLQVIADASVRRGHIRVCTETPEDCQGCEYIGVCKDDPQRADYCPRRGEKTNA